MISLPLAFKAAGLRAVPRRIIEVVIRIEHDYGVNHPAAARDLFPFKHRVHSSIRFWGSSRALTHKIRVDVHGDDFAFCAVARAGKAADTRRRFHIRYDIAGPDSERATRSCVRSMDLRMGCSISAAALRRA